MNIPLPLIPIPSSPLHHPISNSPPIKTQTYPPPALASRLSAAHPHITLHLPTAPYNPLASKKAWFPPLFSGAVPPSSRPSPYPSDALPPLLATVSYLDALLTRIASHSIPPNRIVLAGFSQGGIVSLLHLLTSAEFSGKLAGVASLCGYLPVEGKVQELRTERELPEKVGMCPLFLGQGAEDMWVPAWMWEDTVAGVREFGVGEGVEERVYAGGHQIGEEMEGDLVTWLGKVLPKLE
ncbi:acyl-protein thioesterase-like protein 3 [Elsinoe australis]|uniref:Acyl-protein thioesterase 1 n=1 Tax=Elsinoe australis TaxID=40998 RepID=A0A4U7AX82_9PEZI|nr:acyl-protein thioesterase-like protein 3 [Elsinoe australis]